MAEGAEEAEGGEVVKGAEGEGGPLRTKIRKEMHLFFEFFGFERPLLRYL